MPINSDFLIKHIRPVDADAVDAIFSREFQTYLHAELGMSEGDLRQLALAWATTAVKDPANSRAFSEAADSVSKGRWSEHSQTKVNTVFFLNRSQLALLSAMGNADTADRTFAADFSGDPIAIAVDVVRGGSVKVRHDVTEMFVSTDRAGNICHLNPPPKTAAAPQAASAPQAAPMATGADPATAGLNAVIDLSHNNGTLTAADFEKAKAAGIRAVFHKATQGNHFADPMFVPHLTAARSAGLLIGAYHFGNAADAAAQYAFFEATVRASGLGPMPLVLDYESNSTPQTSMSLQQAKAFLQQAQAKVGKPIGLYSGFTVKDALGPKVDAQLAASWLWLPAYGRNPVAQASWARWTFWQYSDGNVGPEPRRIPGFQIPIDRSVFNGSEAELNAFWQEASVTV